MDQLLERRPEMAKCGRWSIAVFFQFIDARFHSKLLAQFVCFASVGVIGTAVHYAILILCVQLFNLNVLLSSGLGFVGGAITNYILNYRFVFKSKKQHQLTFIKFIIVALFGLMINTLIMWFATEIMLLNYIVSQILSTLLVLLWNFMGNKIWTFDEHKHVQETACH